MKWKRYSPMGAPYSVGDVVMIKRDVHECPLIYVTHVSDHGWPRTRGVYINGGRESPLSEKCTDISTIIPPEEWPNEVCRAVALYNLTGDIS